MSRRSRYDDDDDDDDRPRWKRRRDDDDDRPIRRRTARRKSQGSSLPWVLGLLGGVLLFCGGGGALVYVVAIAPRLNVAQRAARDNKAAEADAKVSLTKLNQLRAGMTKAEVEAVMGPGRPAEHSDVFFATGAFDNQREIELRWQPARELGRVYVWDEYTDRILVAFSKDPNAGGTAVGILGSIDRTRSYSESVTLPGPPVRR